MKLWITKYSKSNSQNYFDTSYFMNTTGWGDYPPFKSLNLINAPKTGKLYFDYIYENQTYIINLYSDSNKMNLVASGFIPGENNKPCFPINIEEKNNSEIYGNLIIYKFYGGLEKLNQSGEIEMDGGIVDWIEINGLPENFLESYSEELFNSNTLKYIVSDFSIKLSLLCGELSNESKTINEFIEDGYIYRVCITDNNNRKFGFINYESKKVDVNEHYLTFDCFSAEKMFYDSLNYKMLVLGLGVWQYNYNFRKVFEMIAGYSNCILSDLTNIDNNIFNKYGEYLKTDREIIYEIEQKTIIKDIVLPILKTLGILVIIDWENALVNQDNKPKLKLLYRDSGINKNIDVINDVGLINKVGNNLKWAIKIAEYINNNKTYYDIIYYEDWSFGKGTTIGTGSIIEDIEQWWLTINYINIPYRFLKDSEFIWYVPDLIELDNPVGYIHKINPLRIFKLASIDANKQALWMQFIIGNKLDYLVTGLKNSKELLIIFQNDYNVLDGIYYNNKEWFIDKISNPNIDNKTATILITEK